MWTQMTNKINEFMKEFNNPAAWVVWAIGEKLHKLKQSDQMIANRWRSATQNVNLKIHWHYYIKLKLYYWKWILSKQVLKKMNICFKYAVIRQITTLLWNCVEKILIKLFWIAIRKKMCVRRLISLCRYKINQISIFNKIHQKALNNIKNLNNSQQNHLLKSSSLTSLTNLQWMLDDDNSDFKMLLQNLNGCNHPISSIAK